MRRSRVVAGFPKRALSRLGALAVALGIWGMSFAGASQQGILDPALLRAAVASAPASEEPSPWPKFEEVTKGMESAKGLFTLWYYPESAKDKDKEKLLCQIPAGFLSQNFMISTSISGGGFTTGFPLDERVVKWELLDRQLVLIEPQTRYVVDEKGTVSDVVRRTYPDTIRAAVPIVTKSPAGDPVIDLGPLLKGSLADLGWSSFSFMMRGGGGGGVNPALSKWLKKKAFELNVEIGVELAIGRSSPPGSFDKKLLHYSFWKLPQTDYKPRIADDRIGYFLTANQDWSKPSDTRDLFNRYIDRWNLVKRDPSLAKCEPREPIVFYVEKTVPVRFRKAVRDGILEWNKAFEKVGFVDAVQVRQQTDDNEWKDLDPEDMRYSFFRWIVTGAGFAMGPHRSNPFTGQIYDADIVFDDSVVRYAEQEAREMLPQSLVQLKMSDIAVQRFMAANPQWLPGLGGKDIFQLTGDDEQAAMRDELAARLSRRGLGAPQSQNSAIGDAFHHCGYAEGMAHQLIVARAVLADQPKEVLERLTQEIVKEIVTHEVGHTLGLRHNFKASSIYTLDEIRKRRLTGEAVSGSIMDYNPVLYFGEKPAEGTFVTPTIGPWDYWVIEYGYRPADGSYKPQGKGKAATKPAEPVKAPDKPAIAEGGEKKPSDIPPELLDKLPAEVRKMLDARPPGEDKAEAVAKGEAKPPLGPEEQMLQAIAGRAAEPELAYATDEDTTMVSPDPLTNRYDCGNDPVGWAKERIALVNKRMANLLDWAVKDGESWYFARNTFMHLLSEKAMVLDYVGRLVGGQYTSRSHRGDPDGKPPFVLVDSDTQRNALKLIEQTLFQDEFFQFSPELLNHLASPRWYHNDARLSVARDFPVHQLISMLQWWNLFDRLMPPVIARIQDAELKTTAKDKLTAAEYLQRLQKACWADSVDASRRAEGEWSDASPFVSDVRRSLQREYLGLVEPMVRMEPGMMLTADLHGMMQHSLRQLAEQIDRVLKQSGPPLDFASAAHLTNCKSRIERMLTPPLEEYNMRQMMFLPFGQQGRGAAQGPALEDRPFVPPMP